MTLEDELPHLLNELANDHAVGLPPALEATDATTPEPRSWRSPILVATAAAACVALLIGGLVVIARRENNSAVIGQPATSLASQSTLPPTTAISNTPTSVASTQPPSSTTAPASASPRRLSPMEFANWLGTWTVDPDSPPVTAAVGSTGTVTYTLELTPEDLCITSEVGSGLCAGVSPGSKLSDQPITFGSFGSSGNVSGPWNLRMLAPLDVELRLLADGVPACDMQRFTLEPHVDVALWACEGSAPMPDELDFEATRGSETVIALAMSDTPPAPTKGAESLAIGGELVLSITQSLNGFAIDASMDKTFPEAVERLRQFTQLEPIPKSVVLDIADSGPFTESDLDQLMQQDLRLTDRVVFITTAHDSDQAHANNELLRDLPTRYTNAVIVDWDVQIDHCPAGCFMADGRFLDVAGQQYLGGLVLDALTIRTPFEATGLRVGDILDPDGVPPGLGDDGQFHLALVPDWISVGRDGVVIGFVRKVDTDRVPPPPTDPPQEQALSVIYDDDGQPIGQFGTDGFPHLITDSD